MEVSLDVINKIAIKAGEEILKIYLNEDLFNVVDYKSDDSPLTLADKESNDVIEAELIKHYPHIPILSEEGADIPFEERKNWKTFWLVDPLDGTKEFIKRNGEFTVNIALIENNKPILGVIYTPVTGELYFASKEKGAFKSVDGNTKTLKTNDRTKQLTAVGSRSHASVEDDKVLSKYDVVEKVSIGSSLKFCLLAESKADIYYRHGPTMEWDTAAGQAIVECSGGMVLDNEGKSFTYNKESLRNGSFLCLSNSSL
jgi:3'(2'), 5'-bisphosphate nucleotidase